MSGRAGWWIYTRERFANVETECGFRARVLLWELVDRARIEDGDVTTAGGKLRLLRGEALFSSVVEAQRFGVNSSTMHRTLKALERGGYVKLHAAHTRLHTKLRALPTIVSIVSFGFYMEIPRTVPPFAAHEHEKKGKHDLEGNHQERGFVSLKGGEEVPRGKAKTFGFSSAVDLLNFYLELTGSVEAQRALALERIEAAMQEYTIDRLANGIERYHDAYPSNPFAPRSFFMAEIYPAYC